jgi:hypothetical protein
MMNIQLSWDTGIALWALDLLRSDQIVEVAGRAPEGESEAIRKIVYRIDDSGDLPQLFADALRELDVTIPSKQVAARRLAAVIASDVLDESMDPFEAARILAIISRAVGPGFHDLDAFVYAESEAEDRPDDIDLFRKAILDEARRWATTRA